MEELQLKMKQKSDMKGIHSNVLVKKLWEERNSKRTNRRKNSSEYDQKAVRIYWESPLYSNAFNRGRVNTMICIIFPFFVILILSMRNEAQ